MRSDAREFAYQTSVIVGTVSRRALVLITLLAGWFGAHKFFLGARLEGLIYLGLSWTGVPALAALMDLWKFSFWPAPRVLKTHPADRNFVSSETRWQLGLAALALALLFGVLQIVPLVSH